MEKIIAINYLQQRGNAAVDKRKKESSLIQYVGFVGKIIKLIDLFKGYVFPQKKSLYHMNKYNKIKPAMTKKQIAAVSEKICKASIKGFNNYD